MRIEPFDRRANVASVFCRIAAGSNGPLPGRTGSHECVGKVNLLASTIGQRLVALVSYDADNLHPLSLRRAKADQNALADRRLVREGLIGELLVDDHQVATRYVVRIGERASRDQGRAHALKIAGQHNLKIHRLKLAGVREGFLRTPADRTEVPSQGKGKRGGDALDAGDGAQTLLDLMHKSGTLFRCLSTSIPKNLKGQESARIEARVNALQFKETPEHQSRSDEQHERESDFRHHHKFP